MRTVVALILAFNASMAVAQIYRCPTPNGQKAFQQAPCTGGTQLQERSPPPISDPDDRRYIDFDDSYRDVDDEDREPRYPRVIYYRPEPRPVVVVVQPTTVVRPVMRQRPRPIPPEPIKPGPVRPAEVARLKP